MKGFDERLKLALLKRGMRPTDLAQKLDVSRSSISQYTTGARVPSPALCQRIAEALNVDYWWLIGTSNQEITYALPNIDINEIPAEARNIPLKEQPQQISESKLEIEAKILASFDNLDEDDVKLLYYTIKALEKPDMKTKIMIYAKAVGVLPKDE